MIACTQTCPWPRPHQVMSPLGDHEDEQRTRGSIECGARGRRRGIAEFIVMRPRNAVEKAW